MIWDDHQGRCIGELTFRNQARYQVNLATCVMLRLWCQAVVLIAKLA